MVSQRRLFSLLTVLVLISLFVVACERPLGGGDTVDETSQTDQTTDPNSGGGVDNSGGATTVDEAGDTTQETGDTGEADAVTTDEQTADTSGEGDDTSTEDNTEAPDDSAEAGGGAGDATGDDAATTDDSTDDENTSEETTGDNASADTSSDDAATTGDGATNGTIPATHTVAAGENLYRIGLKYGISWVAIANENGLANPNAITVGQVLKLPGNTTTPDPTPSPQTETTYIVKAGDTLFRIGVQFGISWVQIAEANGLVNPNLIKVGDELKIPVNTPGPAPQFSHVVKQGETLFLISLQYGVAWPAIAEANNLTSPYVIYVGQTLEIPSSQ